MNETQSEPKEKNQRIPSRTKVTKLKKRKEHICKSRYLKGDSR